MLSRDQVLHVARLARLELTEDEVERFRGELSKVLDHIEKIAELGDLDDVEPTSHVVAVENALRADEPRPSLPPEVALESAPDPARGGFRVPSPGPSRDDATSSSLTAAPGGRRASARGDLDAGELWRAYRERALADELNAFTWVSDAASRAASTGGGPLGGVPIARQGPVLHQGRPEPGRLEDPRGLPAAVHGDGGRAAASTPARRVLGQDQPGRVRDGLVDRELRLRADAEPVGPHARARAARRAARPPRSPPASSPWSIGTDTGGSIRQPAALCGIVGLKPTYGAISRYGMIAFASSLDQAGPFTRDVTDAALLLGAMAGADPCDSTSLGPARAGARCRRRPTCKGIRLGVPEELTGEGIEPGVLAAFNATLDLARELGATVETMRLPHAPHALAAYYLIAPGRVLEQPRPLRRRPLRPARRRRGDLLDDVHRRRASRASAPRSSGAS